MSKRALPDLVTERLRLRLLREEDLPLTLAWRNQDHIRKWFFRSDPIDSVGHRAWFARYWDRDDDFVFIIEETRELKRPVGQVALYNVDWPAGRAEFGRLLIGDGAAAGRGLALEATRRLVDEALGELGLREVHLEVFSHNRRAVAIYEACDFAVEEQRDNVLVMVKRKGAR